jgi:hypothetical protein
MRIRRGSGYVIVQEHDKRLACGYPGGGSSGRINKGTSDRRRDQH